MRKLLLAWVIFLSSYHPTLAVEVNIISYPSTIGEEKFAVTVQVEGASVGVNYLRIDLYQEGTTKYFGETDNGQAWYGGSDGKQYIPINIVAGNPSIATVSGRLGEPTISDYPGPGSYLLRIRRYTSSGNQGSEDSNPKAIQLTKAWPSPTPSPMPTPTPSPTLSPSPTPTSTPSPTPTPTPKPSVRPVPSPVEEATVAGITTYEIDLSTFGTSPTPSLPGDSQKVPSLNKSRAKTALMTGSGLVLLSISGYFGYRKYLSVYNRVE